MEKADTSLDLLAVLLFTQPRVLLAFSAAFGQKGQEIVLILLVLKLASNFILAGLREEFG